MTMFLIQSLLWLLAAFLLGYGIGRWLKGLFCKQRSIDTRTKLETETTPLRVPVTGNTVVTGTSAAAALARSREPVIKPTANVKQPEVKVQPVPTEKVPEHKATVIPLRTTANDLPKVPVETPKQVVNKPVVDLKAPAVDLPKVEVHLPKVDIDLPKLDLNAPKIDITAPKAELDLAKLDADLARPTVEAKLPQIDTPSLGETVAVIGAGAAALGATVAKLNTSIEPDNLITVTDPTKSLDTGLDFKVETKPTETRLDEITEIGSLQSGLVNKDWLASLKAAALARGHHLLAGAADQVLQQPDLSSVDIGSLQTGLTPEWLEALKKAAAGAGLTAATTQVTDVLAAQSKPVDESDLIEAEKHAALATLDNISTMAVTELGSIGQGLNANTLASLKFAAASAGTVAAVQANLNSGSQPMIVDESDAIEAIKLAWDGELSPAELAALEHTLILRPGETGRLGLVTCSVTGANCVSLGGLEADLQAGNAMRSNLFNMAVTHNDDGNYVFSSLSRWLPDWLKSGDFSEHTDELAQLVWDNDPSAVQHAAGYQLVLRPGQYGNLGLVSCAVNESGSVSLGGLVGSVADGQTAVSKLYGILVERAGEVYTFKQFSKPATGSNAGAWLDTVKLAGAAVATGVAAHATGAVGALKATVMPATTSTTTDKLDPDLTWSSDKLRISMQRLIEDSHQRRGSKLVSQLWDADSGYDCGIIEGDESLVLKPGLYGKLGSIHCGVTKPGRVVVSGDVSALAEGEGILFHLYNIVVCRDDDDNYRFERLNDLV